MKGSIVNLMWVPGYNIKSSKGHKKHSIKEAVKTADYVKNNGRGNYSVIKFSKYIAVIRFEDGSIRFIDVKQDIKDYFNVTRLTKTTRAKFESELPISVECDGDRIKFVI